VCGRSCLPMMRHPTHIHPTRLGLPVATATDITATATSATDVHTVGDSLTGCLDSKGATPTRRRREAGTRAATSLCRRSTPRTTRSCPIPGIGLIRHTVGASLSHASGSVAASGSRPRPRRAERTTRRPRNNVACTEQQLPRVRAPSGREK